MACDRKRILYYEVQVEKNPLNDTPGSSKVICFCPVGAGVGG